MNKFKRSWSGRVIALALMFAILGFICAPLPAAEEESEASSCESAVLKCVSEAILSGLLSAGATLPIYLSFCLIGYAFCEKYVEKYI